MRDCERRRMKKTILILSILFFTAASYSQLPWLNAQYTITMGDSITKKFQPNFQVQFWEVGIRDSGSSISPAAYQDSIIIWGEDHRGDTILLGMRRENKDTITNILTYDYAFLPSTNFVPYQYFYVNKPTGLVAIWAERRNKNFITGRKTWINFEAIRKIY